MLTTYICILQGRLTQPPKPNNPIHTDPERYIKPCMGTITHILLSANSLLLKEAKFRRRRIKLTFMSKFVEQHSITITLQMK